jgi:hypothetical protein
MMAVTSTSIGSWNGSTYTGLTGLVKTGRAGGAWTGPGIRSSAAAGDDRTAVGIAMASQVLGISATQTATWSGQTVDGNTVLLKYTYAGDANLDGKINIDDYGRIDGNVAASGSVFGYYNGDFNFDGKINIDDYGIIDGNINAQGAALGASDLSLALEGVAAVPEPSAVILGLLIPLALRRHRRA